jgi:hypothetical protein
MPANKQVNYRLPPDLIRLVQDEAFEAGRASGNGRAYEVSAVVERILRIYFETKRKPAQKRK